MSTCQKAARPLARCLKRSQASSHTTRFIRTFTSSSRTNEAVTEEAVPLKPSFDPATVTNPSHEKKLMKSGVLPIGSRRRRAALKNSDDIPFEQLPYQCFQEARKVLAADRAEKMKMIATERLRISKLVATDAANIKGGEETKERRLDSMRRHLEYLKIQADINDPLIKKRFEDGEGDMNKPIYRYLADKQWRKFPRLIIAQRIEQFGIVPDVLPHFEPTTEVKMAFRDRNVQPGEFIDSRVSEVPARLKVQVFDKGERLVTVAVIDSDVPLVDKDSFMSRCHYLATNIRISPTDTSLPLSHATESQLVLPWLPPFAQKGSPYHRYSVFVIQQKPGQTFNIADLKKTVHRDKFNLKSFVDKYQVTPIGMSIFRSIWDEGTAGVMSRAGIEGADIEFKRKKVIALKPKQKARGWEARHSGGKYLSLQR
ncbi:related to ribosomal protein YmL35 of the large subunit, mitochondrial [Rhynchosporium graminicola]|uniref:Large ribosomal subunit protein mL38 n=1 Tax=Rhynchosporium graminicola TaxID=2792576 RepID=A0A1E1KH48_9HELO|nr:related to ribosomal protein YmL35 of the large subunit, mitochondrial [Rhynchosporium commune]